MEPFLALNELARNRPLPLPDIVLPRTAAFGDRCLMSEGPANIQNKLPSMELDHDPEIPSITSLNNSIDGHFYSPCVEVRREKRGNVFLLRGEGSDENSVSIVLRIADQNGQYILIRIHLQSPLILILQVSNFSFASYNRFSG